MSNCELCGTGDRNKSNHCYSYRHKKQMIKLYKLYNKKKEGVNINIWDAIYEECLTEVKQQK